MHNFWSDVRKKIGFTYGSRRLACLHYLKWGKWKDLFGSPTHPATIPPTHPTIHTTCAFGARCFKVFAGPWRQTNALHAKKYVPNDNKITCLWKKNKMLRTIDWRSLDDFWCHFLRLNLFDRFASEIHFLLMLNFSLASLVFLSIVKVNVFEKSIICRCLFCPSNIFWADRNTFRKSARDNFGKSARDSCSFKRSKCLCSDVHPRHFFKKVSATRSWQLSEKCLWEFSEKYPWQISKKKMLRALLNFTGKKINPEFLITFDEDW